jgi:hypothetical protein
MTQDRLLEWTQRRPFEPFRLRLSNGIVHEVRHPEMLIPGRSAVVIATPLPNSDPPRVDDFVMVSMIHIVQVEPLRIESTNA